MGVFSLEPQKKTVTTSAQPRCLAETWSPETIGWWPPNRLIDLRFVPRLVGENVVGKNVGKNVGKPWETVGKKRGKNVGKPWETHGKTW